MLTGHAGYVYPGEESCHHTSLPACDCCHCYATEIIDRDRIIPFSKNIAYLAVGDTDFRVTYFFFSTDEVLVGLNTAFAKRPAAFPLSIA